MAGGRPGHNAQSIDRSQADECARQVAIRITAETAVAVTSEMTVARLMAHMPQVYAAPMMILHMEMASSSAIADWCPSFLASSPFAFLSGVRPSPGLCP